MSIMHQRKDTEELHVVDPVNLLEICGLHVLYISLIHRIIGNLFFFQWELFSQNWSPIIFKIIPAYLAQS